MEECLKRNPVPVNCYTQMNKDLVKKIQNGDNNALSELLLDNGKLVINIMKKYVPKCMVNEYADDLFQQGLLGLQRAAKTYDCEANTVFSTYAYAWIRQYIVRYMENNQLLYIPASIISSTITVKQFVAKYQSENFGNTPEEGLICNETNISLRTLHDVYFYSQCVLSLDAIVCNPADDNDITLIDFVVNSKNEVDYEIVYKELHELLLSLIWKEAKGNNRNYNMIIKYFGLDGEDPMTLRQLGIMYEVTLERVRQILKQIITGLRKSKNIVLLNDYRNV